MASGMPARRKTARSRDDSRWAAVLARDALRDGEFYFSVATTGIYCRPGCPARTPKRENVAFYDTIAEAEAAGFRACKRCKPAQPKLGDQHRDKVAAACRQIEAAEVEPSLDELALAAGLSPHHFHRIFKSMLGVTPKAYATAHRQKRVRDKLSRSSTVTDAIYDSGFNSSGRFYADSTDVLGMTPSDFRAGGIDTDIRFAVGTCSLGKILVAASAKGVCAIFLGEDRDVLLSDLRERFPKASLIAGDQAFEKLTAKVVSLVEAPNASWDLPLDVRGTAFQHRVWQALRGIPAGETSTYAEVAKRIGAPKAVRAVGSACGANPVAIAIPCHRVVRAGGSTSGGGYRWGMARKQTLLAREAKSRAKR
ncbi:MAG: bifunctional DNA-binding transcriptional regulator/O6-methylguanine-DNA methyltransferase Ada [Hyphomicrobiaceae bacterium]|nr:bifunctional DNA-binding transcriptional regulator/O6-methylguanine-DNA methyltransferase Ada [Hyphomicrobiaceae bacterium]